MKILNSLAIIGFTLLALTLFIIVINVAVERSEERECARLANQALTYEGFFYSTIEAQMCGIK